MDVDGKRVFRTPSQMANYFCAPPKDMAKFGAWAFGASPEEVESKLREKMPKQGVDKVLQ